MNTVRSYERLEAEMQSVESQAAFYQEELRQALLEVGRLRNALGHIVNCFPDMPLVALQTAKLALGQKALR
jgi:hypothetical protein